VQAEAAAAARWCGQASDYAAQVGAKPWKYLLVPQNEIVESRQLKDYLRFKMLSG
jgi:type III restriction enzyme